MITNVVWTVDPSGYPVLELFFDGVQARIPYEQTFRTDGIIYLGYEWRDLVPPIMVHDGYGAELELRGWTRDDGVVAEYEQFRAAIDTDQFIPGPRDSL